MNKADKKNKGGNLTVNKLMDKVFYQMEVISSDKTFTFKMYKCKDKLVKGCIMTKLIPMECRGVK